MKSLSNQYNNLLEKLNTLFFSHQATVKLFHFQTDFYGAHKASDKYLTALSCKFDRLMEVAQGITGKSNINKLNITVPLLSQTGKDFDIGTIQYIIMELDYFYNQLGQYCNRFPSDNKNEIFAIVDEIHGDIQQFKYLLNFK